jgi:type II secretory pathway pseudopilin PulG
VRRRRDDSGMTLIEVTVASTLLLSVVFTMGEALTSNNKSDVKIETSTQMQQAARLALENVTRELRTKQSVVGTPSDYSFSFTTSAQGAGPSHTATFRLDAGKLIKQEDAAAPVVLLEGIVNADMATPVELFTYYDINDNLVHNSVASSARRIRVHFILGTDPEHPLEYETDVTFRVSA